MVDIQAPFSCRPGLSFCLIGDRALFLDVLGDRYFCLPRPIERSFVAMVSGNAPASEALDALLASQVLVPSSTDAPPRPCVAIPNNGSSYLDAPLGRASASEVVRALVRLVGVRRALRQRGFGEVLAAFERHKMKMRMRSARTDVGTVAQAFVRTGYVMAAHDQCLLRSLAIAEHMVRAGLGADLVIGVKLEPFKAHCWVQYDGAVVNDRWDVIRDFTPILVL